ncbi:MAG: hypothetical protein LBD33_01330 [Puniceicoccales bacterium]|nr:hypothetical protein [Puniceicoccales bacterium]
MYGGVDSVLSLGITTHPDKPNIEKNEVAPYLGLSYDVTDVFTLDCGYVCRLWTNMPDSEGETGYRLLTSYHPKKTSNEVYVGVAADVFLSPSVYVAYNYQWRELAVEGRVAYTYDLAQFGVSGVAVEFGAKVGYDKADRPHGLNIGDMKKSGAYGMVQEYARFGKAHWFCGANADLVYSFSEHAKARAGVEVVGNSAARDAWQNLFREYPKKMLWFNASIDCSF